MIKLGEVAAVRSGLVLGRKQTKQETEFKYKLLNLRSIKENGEIDMNQLESIHMIEELKSVYLTQLGDLVVRLTSPYVAVLIDESTEGLVIPSSFAVIRTNDAAVLPEYLFWLLNTQKVQQRIHDNTTNSIYAAVKPSYFSEFEFDLLPIEQQRLIVELNTLARKETRLLRELADQKDRYYSCLIGKVQKELK